MTASNEVIAKVRAALGRAEPLRTAPVPPAIDEPITRLVHSEFGLPELFAKQAAENKMGVTTVHVEELAAAIAEFLTASACRTIAIPISPFLEKLDLPNQLRGRGFDVRRWDALTADATYDLDAGLTDVYCAVAETGSLVLRSSPQHGRALSLVPPVHIAIVEPKNLLPDLVDLFEKLTREGTASGTVLITGPSKTADIEMNLVTGVHGPGIVQIFLLQ